ncbi:hypothetical protein OQY15_16545 [Pedobacter sp. MC2016-15]|uniref:hypothetical protein n=1 Tax=Pedobacter sp. MC2016-15 TaxID=2994473 RepID=UPI00224750A2|nr:hypothetical protein [Pedobacter sp. MC2016-15]MCX2480717.1 hypothetical protein [Pedobacter sp. MC2016-15]
MELANIKFGDFVRHRLINRSKKLAVITLKEDRVFVRYENNGIFYETEFFLFELEPFSEESPGQIGQVAKPFKMY